MSPTAHARTRMQQRAIPDDWIALLGCFGVELTSTQGIDRIALPRREAEQLRRRIEGLLKRWDHLVDAYAVISHTDTVITAAHTTARGHRRREARPKSSLRGDLS